MRLAYARVVMDFKTVPKYNPAHIPDYLIYDEMKRRRERDAWQPNYLELPLYQPSTPPPPSKNPAEKYEDPVERGEYSIPTQPDDEHDEDQSSDRGVMIIDMNDLGFEEDEDEQDDDTDAT